MLIERFGTEGMAQVIFYGVDMKQEGMLRDEPEVKEALDCYATHLHKSITEVLEEHRELITLRELRAKVIQILNQTGDDPWWMDWAQVPWSIARCGAGSDRRVDRVDLLIGRRISPVRTPPVG
jgi:hypothetical protein